MTQLKLQSITDSEVGFLKEFAQVMTDVAESLVKIRGFVLSGLSREPTVNCSSYHHEVDGGQVQRPPVPQSSDRRNAGSNDEDGKDDFISRINQPPGVQQEIQVTLVKWNEPYQKLATCDSSGIIFVWIKHESRWSIELINDRNTPVTHFSWSHDGRMALICYQDGFVLVGSVAGQRYWSMMLNIQAVISAGVYAPDDQQVYFGTSSGQLLVMDVHGTMVAQVTLLEDTAITSLAWSCQKFKMEETEESRSSSGSGGDNASDNSNSSTSNGGDGAGGAGGSSRSHNGAGGSGNVTASGGSSIHHSVDSAGDNGNNDGDDTTGRNESSTRSHNNVTRSSGSGDSEGREAAINSTATSASCSVDEASSQTLGAERQSDDQRRADNFKPDSSAGPSNRTTENASVGEGSSKTTSHASTCQSPRTTNHLLRPPAENTSSNRSSLRAPTSSSSRVPGTSENERTASSNKSGSTSASGAKGEDRQHLLAVVFSTGRIYLIKSHDDVTPIVIDTGLAGVHAEWSNSAELLATAGHWQGDRPSGSSTSMGSSSSAGSSSSSSSSANNSRLFVAAGPQLYISRVSRRVASLQLLCRLSVKERVRSEPQLPLLPLPRRLQAQLSPLYSHTIRPRRLQAQLSPLYSHTIRGYVPDPLQLRDFVCRPPSSCHRLHCTMIRHDEDLIPTPGTCYTLYLEYLGGLVPLLKGKRTSKIRPEFVIFDPQSEEPSPRPSTGSHAMSGGVGGGSAAGGAALGRPLSDSSDTEHEDMCASPRLQRRRKLRRRMRERLESEADDLVYLDTLPEHNRLVEVTSNIWGTKFKLHGVASSLPPNLFVVNIDSDPSFNPNVFSEDEEDIDRENPEGSASLPSDVPPIAPMTPRRTPSSYSRHDMITPSPSPWDATSTEEASGNTAAANKAAEDYTVNNPRGSHLEEPVPQDDDDIYVELSAPEIQHVREALCQEAKSSANLTSSDGSHVRSQHLGHVPLNTMHSVSSVSCDQSPPTSLPPTPSRSPSRFFDFDRKKFSTSRPLDVESALATTSKFFRWDSKEGRKKTTTEALLRQLNTLTVAAPTSPRLHGSSGLPHPQSSLHVGPSSSSAVQPNEVANKLGPHQALTSADSRLEVIRFIDEESGESDSRSFSPSPARTTPKTPSCGSTFSSGGGTLASTIATSLANTFNGVSTSPRRRARSKSVGQLQAFEVIMAASSSLSACAPKSNTATVAEVSQGPFHQVQLAQHVHSLQQLTTVDAFLAFRRTMSLKDGKKGRALNGITWPKLQHYGKSRSLDSSLLLLTKRNLLLNTINTLNANQQQKNATINDDDSKLIITSNNNAHHHDSSVTTSTSPSESASSTSVGLATRSPQAQCFRSEHNPSKQYPCNNIKILPKSHLRHQSPSRSPLCDDRSSVLKFKPNSQNSQLPSSPNSTSSLLRRLPAGVIGHRRFSSQSNFVPDSLRKPNFCHQRQHSLGNACVAQTVKMSSETNELARPAHPSCAALNSCSNYDSLENLNSLSDPQSCDHPKYNNNKILGNRIDSFSNITSTCDVIGSDCTTKTFDGNSNTRVEINHPHSPSLHPQHSHHHHKVYQNHYQHYYHNSSLRVETLERQQAKGLKESALTERLAILQRQCSSPSRQPTASPTRSPPTPSRLPPTPSRVPPLPPPRTQPTQARGPPTPTRTPPTPTHGPHTSPAHQSPNLTMRPPYPQPPPTPRHTPCSTPESQRRALKYSQHPPQSPRRHVYAQLHTSSHNNRAQYPGSPPSSSSSLVRYHNNSQNSHCQCTSTYGDSSSRNDCCSSHMRENSCREVGYCVCNDNDGVGGDHGAGEDQGTSVDVSLCHGSKSIPNTPARSRKQRRHQSSSPIRKHILSSPLLSRRRQRRGAVESSDEELLHCSSDAEILCSSSNYRDLETFQKTQLRNKLRRSRGRSDGLGTGSWGGGVSFGCPNDVTINAPPPPPPIPRHKQFMMHNKAPFWNDNSQVYQLDFGGRVTQESAKNFQIEFNNSAVMQFGRIDGNAYTLDFQYPFSAVQAFAVALANVTQRLK
ncbi:uncharacterized protein LOC108665762 [Hyalella azteca]|uniref:Uncharacterized protein LOC108665762 n=1 Tax=Hyalella azteca TaxID=294128 RepID=A0A979FJD1_HYAAZ|nr:uncharacterized protein LOC108665762 [Hyalella azteca]